MTTTLVQVETKKPLPTAKEQIAAQRLSSLDGVSHINIDINGITVLGPQLSHYHHKTFKHPVLGPFDCMEGLWHYVNSEEQSDSLRYMHGPAVNKTSRSLTLRHVPSFKDIIMVANYHRIAQDVELRKLFTDSELPFDYYYFEGDAILEIRPKGHEWIIEMFTNLRKMFKAGQVPVEPDYSFLLQKARAV